ncbi:hypothetical protein BOSP111201_25025 [Bordetella sputigena]
MFSKPAQYTRLSKIYHNIKGLLKLERQPGAAGR